MPVYFVSDVHLRLDEPGRSRRFAGWVNGLKPDDEVVIGGDLCDFWFASRQRALDPMRCEGLRALAAFRQAGGALTIMPGNHDIWLGPFYEQTLGARFVQEPLEREVHGLKVHLVHGHLLGARRPWKAAMESHLFLKAFGATPEALANWLKDRLEASNERNREEADRRHLLAYRHHADRLTGSADIAIFGHIHGPCDDTSRRPRVVVLGGWFGRSSYLRIDDQGATFIIDSSVSARA